MQGSSNLETRYRAAQQGQPDESASRRDTVDTAAAERPAASTRTEPMKTSHRKRPGKRTWLLLVLLAGALLAWLVLSRLLAPPLIGVNQNQYQAVFLTDGTQYVGKLEAYDSAHYKLTSAYFVSSSQTPQVSDKGSAPTASNQVALVKLENGLLGAENTMTIPRDKVLFYENLKPDGQAAKLLQKNQ